MVSEKELRERARKSKRETVALLKKLISANTVNPPGNEWRASRIIEKELKKARIKYGKFEKVKGRSNIVAEIGKGKPKLIIACHLDTVPQGEGWKTNPFRGIEKNGKVFGRGAQDNKGACAATVALAKIVKKYESNFDGKLLLVFAADEERGSEYGMGYLVEKKKLFAGNAIIPDIADNLKAISIGEKGPMFLKVTAFGKQVHGSRPENGINAVDAMALFLVELKKMKFKYKKHRAFSGPTVNAGTIKGGSAPNMVPGKCEAQIDVRFLPGQNPKGIVKRIRRITQIVGQKTGARFTVKIEMLQKPFVLKRRDFANLVKRNIKKATGKNVREKGLEGSTFAKDLVKRGINAVGIGLGDDVAHQPNEYIQISQLVKYTEAMALAVNEMLLGNE